jgi:hypothetical protein
MVADIVPNAKPYGDQHLSPIPQCRAASCAFLQQVTGKCTIDTQPLKHPLGDDV